MFVASSLVAAIINSMLSASAALQLLRLIELPFKTLASMVSAASWTSLGSVSMTVTDAPSCTNLLARCIPTPPIPRIRMFSSFDPITDHKMDLR